MDIHSSEHAAEFYEYYMPPDDLEHNGEFTDGLDLDVTQTYERLHTGPMQRFLDESGSFLRPSQAVAANSFNSPQDLYHGAFEQIPSAPSFSHRDSSPYSLYRNQREGSDLRHSSAQAPSTPGEPIAQISPRISSQDHSHIDDHLLESPLTGINPAFPEPVSSQYYTDIGEGDLGDDGCSESNLYTEDQTRLSQYSVASFSSPSEQVRQSSNPGNTSLRPSFLSVPFRPARRSRRTSSPRSPKRNRERIFPCVFAFAGCTATFSTKNEWKRHANTRHVHHIYYVCTEEACARSRSRLTPFPTAVGKPFTRKDLYASHVQRTHVPEEYRSTSPKDIPGFETQWGRMLDAAKRIGCPLPQFLECSAGGCNRTFEGPNTLGDWMEHLAPHLQRASEGEEPPVWIGGHSDRTFTDWAMQHDVGIVACSSDGGFYLMAEAGRVNPEAADPPEDAEGEPEHPELFHWF